MDLELSRDLRNDSMPPRPQPSTQIKELDALETLFIFLTQKLSSEKAFYLRIPINRLRANNRELSKVDSIHLEPWVKQALRYPSYKSIGECIVARGVDTLLKLLQNRKHPSTVGVEHIRAHYKHIEDVRRSRFHKLIPSDNIFRLCFLKYLAAYVKMDPVERLGVVVIDGFDIVISMFSDYGLMARQQLSEFSARNQTVKRIARLSVRAVWTTQMSTIMHKPLCIGIHIFPKPI